MADTQVSIQPVKIIQSNRLKDKSHIWDKDNSASCKRQVSKRATFLHHLKSGPSSFFLTGLYLFWFFVVPFMKPSPLIWYLQQAPPFQPHVTTDNHQGHVASPPISPFNKLISFFKNPPADQFTKSQLYVSLQFFLQNSIAYRVKFVNSISK